MAQPVLPRAEFEYDPTLPTFQEDPLPIFRTLRDEHPVYHNERLRFWALTRFDDVYAAASDWQTFASSPSHYPERPDGSEPTALMPLWMMDFGIFYLDPPRHNHARALLAKTFTPRRVDALRPRVRALAEQLLDPLLGAGPVDYEATLADALPIRVTCELLGVPESAWSTVAATLARKRS